MSLLELKEIQTVGQLLEWGETRLAEAGIFFGHGTDNAWDEALVLVTHVMKVSPFIDQRFADEIVSTDQVEQVADLLEQRIEKRTPAPYLTGEAWFCGLRFKVNEDVLIPRSPIAEMIEHQFQPWLQNPPARILDLCTGSGCIGIACAYAFPNAEVVISDISEPALHVARGNIQQHQLEGRVVAIQSDLFGNLQQPQQQKFDLIVSNSPYVDARDLSEMPDEYRHEPSLALASGDDGLDFTRRLLAEAAGHLNDGGLLVAEVGNSWQALEQAYPELPFTWVEFEFGGHGVFVMDKNQLNHLVV